MLGFLDVLQQILGRTATQSATGPQDDISYKDTERNRMPGIVSRPLWGMIHTPFTKFQGCEGLRLCGSYSEATLQE